MSTIVTIYIQSFLQRQLRLFINLKGYGHPLAHNLTQSTDSAILNHFTMSSGLPSLTILSEEQKFNGDNLLQWTTNMVQLLGSKGLFGYVNGSIPKPDPPTTQTTQPTTTATGTTDAATITVTPIYSSTPSLDEWIFRDQLARGHITLNCTDITSLGVMATGTAKEAWDSIKSEWGKSTDMRRSHAQDALNQTVYVEGTDIQEHVKLLRTRKAAVENMSTSPMSDETWRGIVIRSIPTTPKWLPVIPSLYAMSTSADIISTLFAHRMILGRNTSGKPATASNSLNTALAATTDEGPCTNPGCKAKKRSTHSTKNCYWPGGGKEGQFPPNFGQRSKANAATPNTASTAATAQTGHFVLSARVPETPGQTGIIINDIPVSPNPTALISKGFQKFGNGGISTFLDSGASDMMFVSREYFTDYTPSTERMGDSAKADNGGFEIAGEGNVVQCYKVNGKEQTITYTRALHTPSLNANLISVSTLDRHGLWTTFGSGKGVTRKEDGTIILVGKSEDGMYLLDVIDHAPSEPTAALSLSQPTSLEQWHRRLAHCSPLTIQEMASKNLHQ